MKLASLIFISLVISGVAQASLSPNKQIIKDQIIALAKANTTNTDKQTEVRSQLEQLVAELTNGLPPVDATTWSLYAPGSWKQIWADEANNDNSPIEQNLDAIYQYVTPMGRAVNLGERILPDDTRVTFALEARGTVQDNVQTTTILKGFSKEYGLLSSMSIEYLALDILDDKLEIFTPVPLQRFPDGPIDAQSDLTFDYLDEDLKIGTAPNVFTGVSEMFVLIKMAIVP